MYVLRKKPWIQKSHASQMPVLIMVALPSPVTQVA